MTEKHAGGRPRKYETVEAMEERIEAYFATCDERVVQMVVGDKSNKELVDVPRPETYTVQGLSVFLDLSREGLLEYEKREEFSDTIKHARARIEANKVTHMLDGDGPVAGYIFDLKNNCNWRDKQELAITDGIKVEVEYVNSPRQGSTEDAAS